jgi:hypothetical protein
MALPDEACARWEEIERALGAPGPLSPEVRRYLWDVAHLLNKAVEGDDLMVGQRQRLTPKQAAAHVPAILGLTGHAIGAYREARRADTAVGYLELMKKYGILKRGQNKAFIAKLADSVGVEPGHIYRLARSRPARRGK